MEKWYCCVDGSETIETEVPIKYMGLTERVKGLKCPTCGVIYLTEETAELLSASEAVLESK